MCAYQNCLWPDTGQRCRVKTDSDVKAKIVGINGSEVYQNINYET